MLSLEMLGLQISVLTLFKTTHTIKPLIMMTELNFQYFWCLKLVIFNMDSPLPHL